MSVPLSEPRRPTLMVSPSTSRLLGSPRMQWSNFSPRSAAHCSSLTVPLTATPSSSPVIKQRNRALVRLAAVGVEIIERRGDEAGDAALHVDGAAAVKHVACDLAGKRRMTARTPRCPAARHRYARRTPDWVFRCRSARTGSRLARCRVRQRSCDGRQIPPAPAAHANRRARRPPPASPTGSGRDRGRWRRDRQARDARLAVSGLADTYWFKSAALAGTLRRAARCSTDAQRKPSIDEQGKPIAIDDTAPRSIAASRLGSTSVRPIETVNRSTALGAEENAEEPKRQVAVMARA